MSSSNNFCFGCSKYFCFRIIKKLHPQYISIYLWVRVWIKSIPLSLIHLRHRNASNENFFCRPFFPKVFYEKPKFAVRPVGEGRKVYDVTRVAHDKHGLSSPFSFIQLPVFLRPSFLHNA